MILLVRHAETDLNAARVVQPADTPLGRRGLSQSQRLGARIAELGTKLVLTSDLRRARMTADAIIAATGAPYQASALLQERNFGALRGTPYAELKENIFAPGFEPPGGESESVFAERVAEAWRWIQGIAAEVDGNVTVVTHGLVCRGLALGPLKLDATNVPARFGNTSLTIVSPRPPHSVSLLNCVAHLTADTADDGTSPAGI